MKIENKLYFSLALLLILSFFLNVYGIGWGLPSFNAWAADELIPARVLEGISKGFSHGWYYKYPPIHYYLLTILYAPILLLDSLNLLDINNLSTYTTLFYLGRFLSVIQGTAIVFFVYLCGQEIYEKRAALFAAFITAILCPFIYYAKVMNLDVPYLFWFLISLWFYLRIFKYQKLRDYLGYAATAAIAVATKDQAYALYILPPVFVVFIHYFNLKKQQPETSFKQAIFDQKILYPLGTGVLVFLLAHNIVFNLDGFFGHVKLITGGGASIRPRYEENIIGHLKMFGQTLRHLRFSFGWPMFLICLVGFFINLWKKPKNFLLYCLLVPLISYYLFYITPILFNDVRYLLPCSIILAFFGGKLIADFLNQNQRFFYVKLSLITAVFIYTVFYSFTINLWMTHDSRYYVENWMNQNVEKSALIYSVGSVKYLPRMEAFNYQNTDYPSLADLEANSPEYIILSSGYHQGRFAKDTPNYNFFEKVQKQQTEYKLVLEYRYTAPMKLLDYEELNYRSDGDYMHIYSNFDKINPLIQVYQKNQSPNLKS